MRKYRFWAMLAGFPLWLESTYPYAMHQFHLYRIFPTDAQRAEFAALAGREAPISLTQAELDALSSSSSAEEDTPPGYPESLELYRKICDLLLPRNVLLFHCSAVALDGSAYLFTAPSGTGKSTHARLWRERFHTRLTFLNDDKPLLRFLPDGQVLACGTPYAGKEGLHTNNQAPVKGILVLRQSPCNTIQPLTPREAFPIFYQQAFRALQRPELLHTSLDLIHRLAQLPAYTLNCNISQEAVTLAHQTLTGGSCYETETRIYFPRH